MQYFNISVYKKYAGVSNLILMQQNEKVNIIFPFARKKVALIFSSRIFFSAFAFSPQFML